ncbi:MAG: hypothetical protein AAGF94_15220 [Pseudomonadota bacterium]
MPSFSKPPESLQLPDGFVSFEEAFHRVGEHTDSDWDRLRVLNHGGLEKSEEPPRHMIKATQAIIYEYEKIALDSNEANERLKPEMLAEHVNKVRQHNDWVQRYHDTTQELLSLFRKTLPAHALTEHGAVKSINADSWNGIFALNAIASGTAYVQDGFLTKVPTAWQRQAALTQASALPEYCYLIVKAADLERILNSGRPPRTDDKQLAEKQFREFLDEKVKANLNNPSTKDECLAEFKALSPNYSEYLSKRAREKIWKKIIEIHGASAWKKAGRRPKKVSD